MLPLSVTIGFIYGVIGLVGKDYDMPVAVLSALTLGLSIDFAIHFLQRARAIPRRDARLERHESTGSSRSRRARSAANAIVISVGFLPLLTSSLVPYQTVGFFLAAIMAASAVVTLVAAAKHDAARPGAPVFENGLVSRTSGSRHNLLAVVDRDRA